VINDEMPAIADVFRFFAGAARCLPGMAAGEYLEGHTSMIRRDRWAWWPPSRRGTIR
jgi:aminobutyraldehyde dehydrogenase